MGLMKYHHMKNFQFIKNSKDYLVEKKKDQVDKISLFFEREKNEKKY